MSNKGVKLAETLLDLEKVAQSLIDDLSENAKSENRATIVALSGDLGAGKTAFTKLVGKVLGIKIKISSPTFVILKKYLIPRNKNYKFLFHIDAYRLKGEEDLLHLKWEEILSKKENLIFIEWPENVKKVIPKYANYVYIKTDKNGKRTLTFK
jgi:tRNA threonylcarbamoyladenosine biosynthesis protein TsaE